MSRARSQRVGQHAKLRPGDTLVVWKLGRLGRSLRYLVDTVTGLAERSIGFRSLQESIDTTTPGGKLVFHVFAALAEFERDLVRERTRAGLAAARARSHRGGRPSVMTPHKLQIAREMYASKQYNITAIAKTLWGQPRLDLSAPHPRRWLISRREYLRLQPAKPTA
jgi:DNA invertase Pin-like site-specific DNA recombinase